MSKETQQATQAYLLEADAAGVDVCAQRRDGLQRVQRRQRHVRHRGRGEVHDAHALGGLARAVQHGDHVAGELALVAGDHDGLLRGRRRRLPQQDAAADAELLRN